MLETAIPPRGSETASPPTRSETATSRPHHVIEKLGQAVPDDVGLGAAR